MIVKISLIVCIIELVRSERVWINVTTGEVIRKSKNQRELPITIYQPVDEENRLTVVNPMWNCRNSETGFIIPIPPDEMLKRYSEVIKRAEIRTHKRRSRRGTKFGPNVDKTNRKIPNPDWICTNNGNGNMLIISSEVMVNKFQINPHSTDPDQIYPWSKPTTEGPPIILSTSKLPFPTLKPFVPMDQSKFFKYLDEKVNGVEIIQPRSQDSGGDSTSFLPKPI